MITFRMIELVVFRAKDRTGFWIWASNPILYSIPVLSIIWTISACLFSSPFLSSLIFLTESKVSSQKFDFPPSLGETSLLAKSPTGSLTSPFNRPTLSLYSRSPPLTNPGIRRGLSSFPIDDRAERFLSDWLNNCLLGSLEELDEVLDDMDDVDVILLEL